MIKPEVEAKIKGYLEGFIQGMIEEFKSSGFDPKKLRPTRSFSKEGDLKPFHESILPDGVIKVSEFERSFSTKLGTTFEECARLIAESFHQKAMRGHRVTGAISSGAVKKIEAIVSTINKGGIKTAFPELVQEVVKLCKSDDGTSRTAIADLFVESKGGEDWYFEMKSPKPNKGQCLEATSRFLHIHAINFKKYPKLKTFYAMAYNPYGDNKQDYKHSFAKNYMDLQNQVVIGREFWDMLGGSGTYEEILRIYRKVGEEKGPNMIKQLALGY